MEFDLLIGGLNAVTYSSVVAGNVQRCSWL